MQAPHGVDCPQTCQLHARQAAQGRAKEEAPEGQLCYLCCHPCHSSKLSLCHAHGNPGQPGGMMVQASMHELCIVSMHSCANQHRTTNCNSPHLPPPSNHYLQAHIPPLPKEPNFTPSHGEHNLQDSSMAPPGTCLQRLTKESENIQEACQSQSQSKKRQDDKQNEDVPFTFCFCLLQGWLSCQIASLILLASL